MLEKYKRGHNIVLHKKWWPKQQQKEKNYDPSNATCSFGHLTESHVMCPKHPPLHQKEASDFGNS